MPSLFRKFDSNGNGELTMDEFVAPRRAFAII